MGLLLLVVGVWLALLTFAIIGLNVRMRLLKQELMAAQGIFPDDLEARRADTGLAPGTVVLLVSETCGGCSAAIEALEGLVADGALAGRPVFVLTPDPSDPRVRPPLIPLADDNLYRRLHDKVTPSLIVIGDGGRPAHRAAVVDGTDLPDLLRAAGVPGGQPA